MKLPRHSTASFKTSYWWTTVLIPIWENTSIFYCIFLIHLISLILKYMNYLSPFLSSPWPHLQVHQVPHTLGVRSFSPLLDDQTFSKITQNILTMLFAILTWHWWEREEIKTWQDCSGRGICGDIFRTYTHSHPHVLSHYYYYYYYPVFTLYLLLFWQHMNNIQPLRHSKKSEPQRCEEA